MQLLIKGFPEIVRSPLPLSRKVELVGSYFGVGKAATHIVCLLFYCVLLPVSVFTPELQVCWLMEWVLWGGCYGVFGMGCVHRDDVCIGVCAWG